MTSNRNEPHAAAESPYRTLVQELALFLSQDDSNKNTQKSKPKLEVSSEAERLLRDASAVLSSSRPPANFVVHANHSNTTARNTNSTTTNNSSPVIFDGSVAGSIVHLACALDNVLGLAFLLAMGADPRACHTAFRRLMIHEAACNGSIQCLTLLLEQMEKEDGAQRNSSFANYQPSNRPFLPRRVDRQQTLLPALHLVATRPQLFAWPPPNNSSSMDFLSLLTRFRELSRDVKQGTVSELDAAREILQAAGPNVVLSTASSATAGAASTRPASSRGDGHGNTPLHWAAFKNEVDCVALLLRYNADPNARAHPSGWTPLHDAAYSNSFQCMNLLLDAGANVNARAHSGATPLCFAAQEDAAGAARLLLQRGALLSMRCAANALQQQQQQHTRFSGYTPLHYCAHYNAHHAAKVLLAHPTARDAMEIPDLSERLAIHVAVARGSSQVLWELLHAGVLVEQGPQQQRRPPSPEASPVMDAPTDLRSMLPSQPVMSSKPWNCLSQRSIDECRSLVLQAEAHWSPERHALFTPADRRAVVEVLRVGKHLELEQGLFKDLWPHVLSFCGRGWFEVQDDKNRTGDGDEEMKDAPVELSTS